MPSNTLPKTILLRGDPIAAEGVAGGAIIPGHLVERSSTGTIIVHATAAGVAGALFAKEQDYAGGSIDDAYAALDQTPYWSCRKGDRVYAWLADGEDVAINDQLESAGDGTLQALTTGGVAIAIALEAVDTSDSATATARIRAEVL